MEDKDINEIKMMITKLSNDNSNRSNLLDGERREIFDRLTRRESHMESFNTKLSNLQCRDHQDKITSNSISIEKSKYIIFLAVISFIVSLSTFASGIAAFIKITSSIVDK